MEIFTMIDIVGILGLPYPKHNEFSYNIHCPCCDDPKDTRSKHLNINLRKNVFCCPKCGLGGGMFDMYAYFANVPRKDVYKDLCWKMAETWIRTENREKPYLLHHRFRKKSKVL